MENQEEGISVVEIFKIIWKRKLLAFIIALCTVIIMVLGIEFIYNPRKISYTSEFEFSFYSPMDDTYPSGKHFNYKDIVSLELIQETIAENKEFSKLKAEDIYNNGKISIQRLTYVEQTDVREYSDRFRITVQGLSKNKSLVSNFVRKLLDNAQEQVEKDIEEINYISSIESFKDYTIYDNSIPYLGEQYNFIISSYNELISTYSRNYIVGNKTLQQYYNTVLKNFNSINFAALKVEAENNHYVKDLNSYLPYIELEIINLNRSIEENTRVRDSLRKQLDSLIDKYGNIGTTGDPFTEFNTRIAQLTEEIERDTYKIGLLVNEQGEKYTFVYNEEFDKRINKVYDMLYQSFEELESVTKQIYSDETKLIFYSNAIINPTGGMGIIITFVISLCFGILLACGIVLIVEFSSRRKENNDEVKEIKE